ncbi:GSCOCG00007739001-RA-CDS, partial [Cotesia congregata]
EKKLLREINFKSTEYEAIYAINQNNEENLYNMRRKAEQDYLEILSKYDKDVGMLYRTMESLIEESNILEIKLKILEDKVSIQKREYEELKNEREMAIAEAFAETLNNFKRNRAAR